MKLTPQTLALAKTPAFKQMLREIGPQIGHMEALVIDAASKGESLETIRYTAGRLDGARYLLGVLEHVEKKAEQDA